MYVHAIKLMCNSSSDVWVLYELKDKFWPKDNNKGQQQV